VFLHKTRGGQQVDCDRPVDLLVTVGWLHLILHWIDKIPKKNIFQKKTVERVFCVILWSTESTETWKYSYRSVVVLVSVQDVQGCAKWGLPFSIYALCGGPHFRW